MSRAIQQNVIYIVYPYGWLKLAKCFCLQSQRCLSSGPNAFVCSVMYLIASNKCIHLSGKLCRSKPASAWTYHFASVTFNCTAVLNVRDIFYCSLIFNILAFFIGGDEAAGCSPAGSSRRFAHSVEGVAHDRKYWWACQFLGHMHRWHKCASKSQSVPYLVLTKLSANSPCLNFGVHVPRNLQIYAISKLRCAN